MTHDEVQRSRRERLSRESQRLLTAIDEVHDLEKRKRRQIVSSPTFHDLAERIVAKSREVFRRAVREADQDDDIETSDTTLDDVAHKR